VREGKVRGERRESEKWKVRGKTVRDEKSKEK
jgi:hypothetical protein